MRDSYDVPNNIIKLFIEGWELLKSIEVKNFNRIDELKELMEV